MSKIIRFVEKLFGKYKTGYEYWVYLKDIKVPGYYKRTRVRKNKWIRKMDYWLRTGEFESKIILDRDFNLKDGYSSIKIAYLNKLDKVPVYFVDKKGERNDR